MTVLELVVWFIAGVGWMLDWATTIWPNKRFPEQNPFVVQLFGKYPSPISFGLGKLAGLIAAVLLYLSAHQLFQAYDYLPKSLFGIKPPLFIPSVIGIMGWHGFLHNVRLFIRG